MLVRMGRSKTHPEFIQVLGGHKELAADAQLHVPHKRAFKQPLFTGRCCGANGEQRVVLFKQQHNRAIHNPHIDRFSCCVNQPPTAAVAIRNEYREVPNRS